MKKQGSIFPEKTAICQAIFVFLAGIALFAACTRTHNRDQSLDTTFVQIDSLYLSGNLTSMSHALDSVRGHIGNDDVVSLGNYYYYMGVLLGENAVDKNNYADSALSLYPDIETQLRYKDGYIKALTLKAWIYINYKKYDDALESYFKITSLVDMDKYPVTHAEYYTQIAQLYYDQSRYKLAASYNLIACELLNGIKDYNPQYVFHLTQGALNNAGFSYERAEMLDSAAYLYHKGLEYLDKEEAKGAVSKRMIDVSRIVFLDNLGGLLAKKGDLTGARQLLEQSISIPNAEWDMSKVTAYLKLAHVYALLHQSEKADSLLKIAESLTTMQEGDKYHHALTVDKTKSDIYLAEKNYKEAYNYLKKYLQARDSISRADEQLASMDLRLKFESMQSKKDLAALVKTNQYKNLLLLGAALCLVMLIFIVWLAMKNTRQAKRVQKVSIEHSKELEGVIKQLEQRNQEYAKIMKVMAHDLKDPLGVMVGISNLMLSEEQLSANQKEMLQLIAGSGVNSLKMINELLHSGSPLKDGPVKEKVDLQHLLQQCTELLQYKATEKGQEIHFSSESPLELVLSREKIWRVFNNLLVNAIKFSPENTTVKVTLERVRKSARVAIADQGIGISKENRQKIFELFTSARRPGTAGEKAFGIGLSVSKEIVEEHGGQIWLEDNPGGGTVFYVELPMG